MIGGIGCAQYPDYHRRRTTWHNLQGPSFGPSAGGPPRQLVVLLHGVGSDGQDLIGLAPMLAGTCRTPGSWHPDGPQPCDLAPYGRQWFSLQDRRPSSDAGGHRPHHSAGRRLHRRGTARGTASTMPRLALVGFSQVP